MDNKDKVVVFDLDETLGHFVELGMFCDALESFNKKYVTREHFFEIIDLFSDCLRPYIIEILRYLKSKKERGECEKIMVYTNNQGPRKWTENISGYFDNKLESKLFDNIVCAFKVGGKRIELGRTTHEKTVKDLINCTKIPEDTKICFLDDQYHPYMKHKNVYYINIKPYVYEYPFAVMGEMYFNKFNNRLQDETTKEDFTKYIVEYMNRYEGKIGAEKKDIDIAMDKIISKKILGHLRIFFGDKGKGTRKKNRHITGKKIRHTKKIY